MSLSVPVHSFGRITKGWTYQELFDKADLVVVATVIATKDTEERTTLKDITPAVAVIGVVTEFETRLVLKGCSGVTTFRLHHYRVASGDERMWVNGPALIRIAGSSEPFLLFLIKERNGMYAPVSGQTDPASLSVLTLGGTAE